MSKIYLGKQGRIFGPYSEEDLSVLRKKGDLQTFHWIWDEQLKRWSALEPPPIATPQLKKDISDDNGHASTIRGESILASLYDARRFLSGVIEQITETGCVFQSEGNELSPLFSPKTTIVLNLFDEERGMNCNVSVRIQSVEVISQRQGLGYEIRWEACPKLLRACA